MHSPPPFHLYSANTPNGQKISIVLEELNLTYEQTTLDLGSDEQKSPVFCA